MKVKNLQIFSIVTCVLLVFFTSNITFSQWTLAGAISGAGQYPSISVVDDNTVFIFGGLPPQPTVFRSTDGGVNFTTLGTTGLGSFLLTCGWAVDTNLVFVGNGGADNGAGGNASFYKTTNGGASWTVIDTTGGTTGFFNGIVFSRTEPTFGIAESDPPDGWGNPYLIWITTDGGTIWNELNPRPPGVSGAMSVYNSIMVIDEQFYGFGIGYWSGGTSKIYMTADSGANWSVGELGIPGMFVYGFAFSEDKMRGIAGTYDALPTIARTSNGGVTWDPINTNTGITSSTLWDSPTCKWIPNTNICYIAGESGPDGAIAKSTDGGLTWQAMSTSGLTGIRHMDFYTDGDYITGYAVTMNGRILKLYEPVSQDTLHVPAVYANIQEGIDAANNGDVVLVADGTYIENINYKGKAITVASHFIMDGDTNHINNTIIDGSQPSHPDSGSVVYFTAGEDTNSILLGFSIKGGMGTLIDNTMKIGGGVLLYRSGGKILHCRITQNIIESPLLVIGGGICSYSDVGPNVVIISHCLIDSNRAMGTGGLVLGGGMYIGSTAIIEYNFISANESYYEGSNLNGSGGGGIYVGALITNFDVTISNNQIIGNATTNIGGFGAYTAGLDLYDVSFTVSNNVISDNILSSNTGGYGAGLRVVYGEGFISGNEFLFNRSISTPTVDGGGILLVLSNDVLISGNHFEGNEGTWGAGIEDFQSVNTTIEKNTFVNNIAENWAGALLVESNARVINNLMIGNIATFGGGIYVYSRTASSISMEMSNPDQYVLRKKRMTLVGGEDAIESSQKKGSKSSLVNTPLLINNTIVNNIASTGGAIRINGGSQPVLLNSILWGNTGEQIAIGTGSVEVHYSDIQDGWLSGMGNIKEDPMFLDTLDYQLSDSSLCLGTGIDSINIGSIWYYAPPTDLGGNPRPSPTGTMPDMGAWESLLGPVGIHTEDFEGIPMSYSLYQNYPNPFNPVTTISYSLPLKSQVKLVVYNTLGEEVIQLVNGEKEAGSYSVKLDATSLSSGIYFYQLKTEGYVETKKMILLR